MSSGIIRKLKIDRYESRLILNKPADIDDFDGLSFDMVPSKSKYDLIFAFIFSLDEFSALVKQVIDKDMLNPDGYLYFAYPKKGNKRYKEYIGRDDFFTPVNMDEDGFVNGSRMKFNRMVAFNDVFTCIGLKYETKIKSGPKSSQRTADYVGRVDDLREHFAANREVLDKFDSLTPGYQSNWALYVYGVKNEETSLKRLAEMEKILKAGFKSIDLYRRHKK